MKVKMERGFEPARVVRVMSERGTIVGEMHKRYRDGWRGGSTYAFYPNELGEQYGLVYASGQRVRPLLADINEVLKDVYGK